MSLKLSAFSCWLLRHKHKRMEMAETLKTYVLWCMSTYHIIILLVSVLCLECCSAMPCLQLDFTTLCITTCSPTRYNIHAASCENEKRNYSGILNSHSQLLKHNLDNQVLKSLIGVMHFMFRKDWNLRMTKIFYTKNVANNSVSVAENRYCVHFGHIMLSYCYLKNLLETMMKYYVTAFISFLAICMFPLLLDCCPLV
jgi:hypothetical protein